MDSSEFPDRNLLRKFEKIEENLDQLKEETNSKITTIEKDVNYMSEVQKFLSEDVEDLKSDKESRFRAKQVNFDPSGQNLDQDVKKEIMNLRIQHESLFEKNKLVGERVVSLELELKRYNTDVNKIKELEGELAKIDDITSLKKEIDFLKSDLDRRELELKKEMETTSFPLSEVDSSGNVTRKLDPAVIRKLIQSETTHIFEFIQEFVNEIALNSITIVKSNVKDCTHKMDAIDWILRNIEFISPK